MSIGAWTSDAATAFIENPSRDRQGVEHLVESTVAHDLTVPLSDGHGSYFLSQVLLFAAQEILFAYINTIVAQYIVCRADMKIEVRQYKVEEVLLAAKL